VVANAGKIKLVQTKKNKMFYDFLVAF